MDSAKQPAQPTSKVRRATLILVLRILGSLAGAGLVLGSIAILLTPSEKLTSSAPLDLPTPVSSVDEANVLPPSVTAPASSKLPNAVAVSPLTNFTESSSQPIEPIQPVETLTSTALPDVIQPIQPEPFGIDILVAAPHPYQGASLRKQPEFNSERIAVVKNGTGVAYNGAPVNGWYPVKVELPTTDGGIHVFEGWMARQGLNL